MSKLLKRKTMLRKKMNCFLLQMIPEDMCLNYIKLQPNFMMLKISLSKNIRSIKMICALLCLLFTGTVGYSQTVIQAADFGVKKNSFENASYGIQRAINACKGKQDAVLVLPGGRIDIWPEGSA